MANQRKLLSAFEKDKFEDFQKLVVFSDIDVDYFYGKPDNGTLLDLASRSPGYERYVSALIRSGAIVWRKDEKTGKLEIHEIFNNSDLYLLFNIWSGVYSSSRFGHDNANIMKVAVEENNIETIEVLARSYSVLYTRLYDGLPDRQHEILLQGSIDAVRLFIKYFDVDKALQKDSQGRVFSGREIILQKYPELEADLPTRSLSEARFDWASRCENHNASIMEVAVEVNDIEVIKLLAKCHPITYDQFNDDHSDLRLLILLEGSIDAVRLLMMYFDVDKEFQKDSQGRVFSFREIILQKYPELEAELPITQSPSEIEKLLFLYLEKGVPELFVRRIADIGTDILDDGLQEFTGLTYLHVACELNYIDVVDALLKKNFRLNEIASSSNEFAQKVTPIMLAAFNGHYEIFEKLLNIPEVELQNAKGSGSVLHLVLHGMQFMQDQNYPTDGHRMILELLLKLHEFGDTNELVIEHRRLNIEHTDKSDRTALHYALKYNYEFPIKLLLRAGAKLHLKDKSILTSIFAATIIERYFDDCIRSSGEFFFVPGSVEAPIEFHYDIFTQIDPYSHCFRSSIFAVFESVTELRKLYQHPLSKSFLYLKWRFVRKYYYINLVFYLSFCFALSTYIFQIQHCLPSSSDFNSSESTDAAINRDEYSCNLSLWMWVITLLLYIVLILRELCQFSVSIREYVGIPENWFEMTMIVVIGFLFGNETSEHLAATAILMSWIGLILLLGKQPSLSIYIEVFKAVASNFAKFLLLYSILVASFAYSFFILFRNNPSGQESLQNQSNVKTTDRTSENSMNSWQDLQMSFIKSIIMMTGEFEASTLPLDSNFSYGHVFFILFVFLVTMVLYNLLNGLAVSDTRAIMEDAEVVALISRAKLISQIEHLAISNPFHHPFRYRMGYKFLRNKLFGDKRLVDRFTGVYVYPTINNRIVTFYGGDFGKMPSFIVKHAEQIVEKRKQSQLSKDDIQNSLADVTKNNPSEQQFVNELVHQFSEQINNLKLEIDGKNAERDEKLLQNVDQRFDKMINKLLDAVVQEVNLLKNKD